MTTGRFERGHIADAIVGDGIFFIHEPAFTAHDRLHVLRHLRKWATSGDRVAAARSGVGEAMRKMLRDGRPDDAVDILLCLAILAEDDAAVPVSGDQVTDWLESIQRAYAESGRPSRANEAISDIRRTLARPV